MAVGAVPPVAMAAMTSMESSPFSVHPQDADIQMLEKAGEKYAAALKVRLAFFHRVR